MDESVLFLRPDILCGRQWKMNRMVVRMLGEKASPEATRVSRQEATMHSFGVDRPALHAAKALSI